MKAHNESSSKTRDSSNECHDKMGQ